MSIDLAAGLVGLLWNAVLLAVLIRVRGSNKVFIVLSFYLVSFYAADRLLPRVLVDAWPNFDAARTPALRPFVIFPDLLLVSVLALRVRSLSLRAFALLLPLVTVAICGSILGVVSGIPASAVLFWALVPLRAAGVLLLIDSGIQRSTWAATAKGVVLAAIAGSAFLAAGLLAVWVLQITANWFSLDLAHLWSGFDWVRPNLPGWNNNIAASAVAAGASAALLLPDLHKLGGKVVAAVVFLGAAAILASEYRTAIVVLVFSISIRTFLTVRTLLMPRLREPAGFGLAAIAAAALTSTLLLAAAVAVPRMAYLSPANYVAAIINSGESPAVAPTGTPGPNDPGETDDPSTISRAQLIQASLHVWGRQPITGPGLGAWEFQRPQEPTFLLKAITPHNGYAWTLADLGVMGLAAIYVIPGFMILLRRPKVTMLAWLIVLAILELTIVGIAHSRYGVMLWSALAVFALLPPHQEGAPA